MTDLNAYSDVIDSIVSKINNGDYGDNPFAFGSESNDALLADAWEKIGQHNQEIWNDYDEEQKIGGEIMSEIRYRYDEIVLSDAVENTPKGIADAFKLENEQNMLHQTAPAPTTMDQLILNSDNPQRAIESLEVLNEQRIESGETPVYLKDETISALAEKGIDAQELRSPDRGISTEANISSQPESHGGFVETAQTDPQTDHDSKQNNEVVIGVTDAKGNVVDLIINDDGKEIKFSEILSDFIKEDPEHLGDIFKTVVDKAETGEDWREYLTSALQEYRKEIDGAKPDVALEYQNSEPVTNSIEDADSRAVDNKQAKYEANFNLHSEVVDARKSVAVPFNRDTITAYHNMAKVYNAYKGGIKINESVPSVVDLSISIANFIRSSPLETLIIAVVRIAVEKAMDAASVDDKKDVELAEDPKAYDKLGIADDGHMETTPDDETVKSIGAFRNDLPSAGYCYGADMTKVERKTDSGELVIRTTNPDKIDGRGVSVLTKDAREFVFPDIKMVEIKGAMLLVDPFGRVVDVDSDTTKDYQLNQYLARFDVTSKENGLSALNEYAADHKMTAAQAKDEITSILKTRYTERVELTYKIESKAIEQTVIPREKDVKTDLVSKAANLDRMESVAKAAGDTEAVDKITEMRSKIETAIKDVDSRILNLQERAATLDRLSERSDNLSAEERFKSAVSSEKSATGRSVYSIELIPEKKEIDIAVDKGIENIRTRLDAFNADKPEMDKLSYDAKTAQFIDRYGITEKGEYVGNSNGRFMADGVMGPESPSKEDTDAYIEKHFDPERFDIEKIIGDQYEPDAKVDMEPREEDPAAASDDKENIDNNGVDVSAQEEDVETANDAAPFSSEEVANMDADNIEVIEADQNDALVQEGAEKDVDQQIEKPSTEQKSEDASTAGESIDEESGAVSEVEAGVHIEDPLIEPTAIEDEASLDNSDPERQLEDETLHDEQFVDKNQGKNEAVVLEDTDNEADKDTDKERDREHSETHPQDGEVVHVDGKNAVENKETSDEETESRNTVDEVKSWIDDMMDEMNISAADAFEGFQDVVDAKADQLGDILSSIESADTLDEVVDVLANSFVDGMTDAFQQGTESNEALTEAGSEVFCAIVDTLGFENSRDLINAVTNIVESNGAEENLYQAMDHITDRGCDELIKHADGYYEIDGMVISQDAITDAVTGDPVGGFESNDFVEEFCSDIELGFNEELRITDFSWPEDGVVDDVDAGVEQNISTDQQDDLFAPDDNVDLVDAELSPMSADEHLQEDGLEYDDIDLSDLL